MKIEQLVAVLVRFFVLYVLMTVIFHYGMAIATIVMQNQRTGVEGNGVIVITLVILLGLLSMLWWLAPRLARAMTPAPTGEEITAVSTTRLEVLLFSLMGLWLVVTALPEITRYGVYIMSIDAASRRTEIGLYGHLVQLATGLWLLVGSKGIVSTLRKLRGRDE